MDIYDYITIQCQDNESIIRLEFKKLFLRKGFDPAYFRDFIVYVAKNGEIFAGFGSTDETFVPYTIKARRNIPVDSKTGVEEYLTAIDLNEDAVKNSFNEIIINYLDGINFKKLSKETQNNSYALSFPYIRKFAKVFSQALRDVLKNACQYETIEMLSDHISKAPLEIYNHCIRVPNLKQVYEIAPILGILWTSHFFEQKMLNLKMADQIKYLVENLKLPPSTQQTTCDFNPKGTKSALYFVKTVKRNGFFMRIYDASDLLELLKKISHIDINLLRRLDTAIKWKCFLLSLEYNVSLAETLLLDGNFEKHCVEKAGSTKYIHIREALSPLIDYARANTLPKAGFKRLWDEQALWHGRLTAQLRSNSSHTREQLLKNNIDFPQPEIGTCTKNDLYVLKYLGSELEIFDEGVDQRHCVHTYAGLAKKGLCFIYSLRDMNDKSVITIELNSKYDIIQAKGPNNRQPSPLELKNISSLLTKLKEETKTKKITKNEEISSKDVLITF